MFEYNEGTVKENQIRISPSSVGDLITNFPYWFKAKVLKQPYDYGKPDNRVLGTVVHAMIDNYYSKEMSHEVLIERSSEYIINSGVSDSWDMIQMADVMFEAWIEEFGKKNKPSSSEQWVEFEPNDRIKISGTYDAIFDKRVHDWKTTASKKSDFGSYKSQLYLYAWLLRRSNVDIDEIGITYIQKPLKSGKVNVVTLIEPIDDGYMNQLIIKIQKASKKAIEALDNDVIREFISEIDVRSPYDRSSI